MNHWWRLNCWAIRSLKKTYRYRLYTFYYLSSVPVFDFFWLFGHRIFRLVPRTTDSRVAFFQGGGLTQKKKLSSQETPRATKNTPNAAISPNTCFVPFFQGNSYRVVSDTAMLQHDHAARGGRKCWVCTQLRSTQRWAFFKGVWLCEGEIGDYST